MSPFKTTLWGICLALVSVGYLFAQTSPFAPPPEPAAVRGLHDLNTVQSPAVISPPVSAAEPVIDYSVTPTPTAGEAQLLEGGQILARIDGEIVLASDVLWQVNLLIEANLDRIPKDQIEDARRAMLRQQVVGLIDTKVLYADFRRKVPAENIPKVEQNLSEPFEEMEIPRLCKMFKVSDKKQLETELARYGGSLGDLKRQFIERTIAGEWLRNMAPKPKAATHEELIAFYREHQTDFDFPAQARWEELAVHTARMHGDRAAAWRAIAEMGNEVWQKVVQDPGLRGPVFNDVAKSKSHGLTAAEGGLHDWTTKGALRSSEIDKALFSLSVGQMSDVIEDELGFHIVRVLERKEAGRTPFTEAQAEITKILEADDKKDLIAMELTKLREKSRIWTVFDGEFRGSEINARRHESTTK